MPAGAARVVLDTNVLLDFWVFDDARARPLRRAVEDGRVAPLRSQATDDELADVLARAQFRLDAGVRCVLLAHWREWASPVAAVAQAPLACADPADQKFLDLAFSAGAQALATKDRALLALARRAGYLGVLIAPPAAVASALLLEDEVA